MPRLRMDFHRDTLSKARNLLGRLPILISNESIFYHTFEFDSR